MIRAVSLAAACLATFAHAESHLLDADALAALVDQRLSELSPYEALLNDPDPSRSMVAMQLMLDSGDINLVRTATAFGFQAADPALRRMAAKAVLDSGVPLTIAVSGVPEDAQANFASRARSYLGAAVSPEGVAFVTVQFGGYDAEQGCYRTPNNDACLVSLNADGIYIRNNTFSARLGFGDGAKLTGAATISNVAQPLEAELILSE